MRRDNAGCPNPVPEAQHVPLQTRPVCRRCGVPVPVLPRLTPAQRRVLGELADAEPGDGLLLTGRDVAVARRLVLAGCARKLASGPAGEVFCATATGRQALVES